MICGQPNSGKSTFALALVAGMKVPTLFFSADTDEHTTKVRAVACLTGTPTHMVDSNFSLPDAASYYEEVLDELSDVWWCFDSAPTLKDIDLELRAYSELTGLVGPHVIVIDNLMDIASDDVNEWQAMRSNMKVLKYLARELNAAVIVLHHCGEGDETAAGFPPPRRSIQGKLSQLPALILTVANNPVTRKMLVACVKNRYGEADPTANTYVSLDADLSRMAITEPPPPTDRWSHVPWPTGPR